MAGIRAIRSVCESAMGLLETVYTASPPTGFPPKLDFDVYLAEDFKESAHMKEGVSLFLYRVYVNATQRAARQIDVVTGKVRRPSLSLELHFFLTIWAKTASVQHDILGWTMRTLEDYPMLPAALLNRVEGANFSDAETVEIIAGQLTNEELMRIWDDLHADYQLSLPYIARVVRVDSQLEIGEGAPVLIRVSEYGAPRS